MMSLALRQKFRKLRFQMIADTLLNTDSNLNNTNQCYRNYLMSKTDIL